MDHDEKPEDHIERGPAWGTRSTGEHRWPAAVAVLLAALLQVVLPEQVVRGLGPKLLVPGLEVALLAILLVANPGRITRESTLLRRLSLALIALVNLGNVVSLVELLQRLVQGHTTGKALVFASLPIWLTNVIVFGLWYWELDRGGPGARCSSRRVRPDFLFPQMTTPGSSPGWTPGFLDYLYTSFTNATAFSPTDTMPLTAAAKVLMMVQSLASLVLVAVVVSRAVNILS